MSEMTSNTQNLPSARAVVLAVADGAELVGVVGVHEALDTAGRWRRAAGRPAPYTLTLASLGGTVRSGSGLTLSTARLAEQAPPHTLIVCGALQGAPAPELVAEVARLAAGADRVVSVCAGALVLGAAGLLSGRRCTTHWLLLDRLRSICPDALVEDDVLYTEDGALYTSAGATAGIDLALHLLRRDTSPRLAQAVARALVVFAQRSGGQSQFSAPLRLQPGLGARLRQVVAAVARDPAGDHSVPALARRAGMSPRHFARVFRAQAGETPAAFVRRVRVEAAQALLSDDHHGLSAIAEAVGLGTESTLRRAFVSVVGVAPGVWRDRFGPARSLPTAATGSGAGG